MTKRQQMGCRRGHVTYFKFYDPSISLEWLKLESSRKLYAGRPFEVLVSE